MTGTAVAVTARTGRVPCEDPGGVPPGSGAEAVITGPCGAVHRGHRWRLAATRRHRAAAAPAPDVRRAARAGGTPGPLAHRPGAYGTEVTVHPTVVPDDAHPPSARRRSDVTEGRPRHAARPPGRAHALPVAMVADIAVPPAAGSARPGPGRYARAAGVLGRPLDPRRPGGHRCP
ncbi:hypothetical protein AB0L35_07575 [Streptomyces sp. NPDC052309]|uniref:hypothetical protein n=1 Tax=Streptomyces sp. NPDC052309 TaxID=3155421 RepID=UPI003446A3D2